MRRFRKAVFWLHLVCGVIAGLVIGVMSFTGAVLAFEKEIVAFAERDVRRVTPPTSGAPALPLDELMRQARLARPELRAGTIVVSNDPRAAIALSSGGRGVASSTLYQNPYTGEVRESATTRTAEFMRMMRSWHRWLGVEGEHRNLARAATGASNAAFLGLAITGLYLWWPRSWSKSAVRAIALFNFKLSGKARDFNWHNVIGLWSAFVLIVLTATALPISYAWAGDLIYTLTGTPRTARGESTAPRGPAAGAAPSVAVAIPANDAPTLGHAALLAVVQAEFPDWQHITLRSARTEGARGDADRPRTGAAHRGQRAGEKREGAETPDPRRVEPQRVAGEDGSVAAATFVVRRSSAWPRTATVTVAVDPYRGVILQRVGYAEQNGAQRVRSWTRFLHTGEALGCAGQAVAGVASLGGCLLMWTGFALTWRRFFGRRTAHAKS